VRFYGFDYGKEVCGAGAFVVRIFPGVGNLGMGQFVAVGFQEKTWFIDTPVS
jgi:hypothetical protein